MYICKYSDVCVCVCPLSSTGAPEVNIRCLLQSLPTLIFEAGYLTGHGAHPFGQTIRPTSSSILQSLPPQG